MFEDVTGVEVGLLGSLGRVVGLLVLAGLGLVAQH